MDAKRVKWLGLVLVALLLLACQPATWAQFTSPEGRFSVLMPDIPEHETITVNTAAGPIDEHTFAFEQQDIVYMVGYADYPDAIVRDADLDQLLDGARDGAAANTQGELLSELIISLDGHPGRELKVEVAGGEGTILARIYLVGNRLYQVMTVTSKENAFSTDITKFMDSFRLLEE